MNIIHNLGEVVGFFVNEMVKGEVNGYIMTYPSAPKAGMGGVPGNNFIVSVALVR